MPSTLFERRSITTTTKCPLGAAMARSAADGHSIGVDHPPSAGAAGLGVSFGEDLIPPAATTAGTGRCDSSIVSALPTIRMEEREQAGLEKSAPPVLDAPPKEGETPAGASDSHHCEGISAITPIK